MKNKLTLILLVCFPFFLVAQKNVVLNKTIDSIILLLENLPSDEERVNKLTGFAGK